MMGKVLSIRNGRLAAFSGGAGWIGLILLGGIHDFWTSALGPLNYERYNRLVTVPLLLFVIGWSVIHARYAKRSMIAQATSWLTLFGFVLLLVGNVLEFWVVLLQSRYLPFRLGGSDVWPGADLGWTLFLLGFVIVLVGLLLFGITALHARLLPRWNAVPLLSSIVGISGSILAVSGGRLGVDFENGFAVTAFTLGINWLLLAYAISPSAQPASAIHAGAMLVAPGAHSDKG